MEQKENLKDMTSSSFTEWDAAYPYSFEMELRADKGIYVSEKQKTVGHFPIRADLFIEKTDLSRQFSSVIAKRFQKWNFVEFKAPTDELNFDTFIKGKVYAGLFKISAPKVDQYKIEDITYAFVRQAKPVKLMRQLREEFAYEITCKYDGIYYIEAKGRRDYFYQMIVLNELDMKQCGWLGIMKKGITKEEFLAFLIKSEELQNSEDRQNADKINDIVVKANIDLIRKWKEESDMTSALREIMEEEFQEERTDTQISDIKNLMENLRLTAQEAMNALGIPQERQAIYESRL